MSATIIILLLVAYLIGSIPSAVWIGKTFHGIDVREHGSGNAGATNTFRVLGKKAGIPVLLLDVAKGALAVNLVLIQMKYDIDDIAPYTNLKLAFGFCAVLGHIFPLFAGFRGGKGIATLLGIVLAVFTGGAALAVIGGALAGFVIGEMTVGTTPSIKAYDQDEVFDQNSRPVNLMITDKSYYGIT